ncbi:MAG: NAD(P)/FAD-dependent oxidoreductase [Armatimonadetes bacterium]|nr:NAD(P)/FAD-dependent oxidoreductase [Armatimonadota bacterium]
MPRYFDHLLLGGGTACAYAAVSLRKFEKSQSVAILGEENEHPYDRPPFTKYFLWNDAKSISDFHSKDESFYPENNIELIPGTRAASIDIRGRSVRTESGEEIHYSNLLYALGSEPVRPAIEGADSTWVLRSCADSARIRDAATKGAKAVIVGGGFIGCELASSLAGRGCEVTLIEHGPKLLGRVGSPTTASAAQRELEGKGVRVVTGASAKAVRGGKSVETDQGTFEGDFVVFGIGARPRTALAKESGLQVGAQGVLAKENLQSVTDPCIWLAGDVVEYPDPHLGGNYRVEHHLHAKATADRAGAGMAGQIGNFDAVPYVFSDIGDLSFQQRGYPEKAAKTYVVSSTEEPVITEIFLFDDGRIAGFADFRKDYKAQDPYCELFEKLIKARAVAGPLEAEFREGFALERLEGLLR